VSCSARAAITASSSTGSGQVGGDNLAIARSTTSWLGGSVATWRCPRSAPEAEPEFERRGDGEQGHRAIGRHTSPDHGGDPLRAGPGPGVRYARRRSALSQLLGWARVRSACRLLGVAGLVMVLCCWEWLQATPKKLRAGRSPGQASGGVPLGRGRLRQAWREVSDASAGTRRLFARPAEWAGGDGLARNLLASVGFGRVDRGRHRQRHPREPRSTTGGASRGAVTGAWPL